MKCYSDLSFAMLAWCVLILAGGCANKSSSASPRDATRVDKRVVELFGGSQSITNILAPTKIQVFRVDGEPGNRAETSKPFYGYPIIGGPVEVDAATAKQLAKVLMDTDIYDWDRHKECLFMPGVAVRFSNAGSPTEVLFCFSCDELMVVRDGKQVGYEDFGPVSVGA